MTSSLSSKAQKNYGLTCRQSNLKSDKINQIKKNYNISIKNKYKTFFTLVLFIFDANFFSELL